MAGLAAISDAVVVVRVEDSRFETALEASGRRSRDVTKYDLRIADTLKAYPTLGPIGGVLVLTRLGGQHVENGALVKSAVQGFEDFSKNGEYVLFLTWNKKANQFDIAYGPSGCYQLEASGNVRSLGRTAVALAQRGKGRATFLEELRVVAAR